MKSIVLIFTLFTVNSFAQDGGQSLQEYTASNGVTYKIGDKVKLGVGSATNGSFNYITLRSLLVRDFSNSSSGNANKALSGRTGVIQKIKKIQDEQVYFVLVQLNQLKWTLLIEEAIAKCEVADCEKSAVSSDNKYDKLKKLKGLFDEGVLSQIEYDAEKKKLLDGN